MKTLAIAWVYFLAVLGGLFFGWEMVNVLYHVPILIVVFAIIAFTIWCVCKVTE